MDQTPVVAEYFALRTVLAERSLAIARALNAAGLDGWTMLREYESACDSVEAAFRNMEHADRMTVLTTESQERKDAIRRADEVLAKYQPASPSSSAVNDPLHSSRTDA